MATTKLDIDKELKKKISRKKYLESRLLKVDKYMYNK